jgi:hypothetical protein
MYVIINNSTKKTWNVEGTFPSTFIERMLDEGDDVFVISFYSNTIKFPYCVRGACSWGNEHFPGEWDYREEKIDIFKMSQYIKESL